MPPIPAFDRATLQAVCDILGDTHFGLTGTQIGALLAECGIDDPAPGATKRYRLFDALWKRQEQDRCGNNVAAFIMAAMKPVRYFHNPEQFDYFRSHLNEALAFEGYALNEEGKLYKVTRVRTLSEAEQRADRLRGELIKRGVHWDVLRFCRAELLQENYFHAVLEATKSVAEKIRTKSGLVSDGAQLVDEAFGFSQGKPPLLAFNSLRTETEQGEHRGLMNLLKGMFGTFRNVTAHAPKVSWPVSEQDALDLLTFVSFLHRRIDGAVLTRQALGG